MKQALIFCGGADSAGTGYALKSAIDHHGPGWQARAIRRKNSWLDYPADITWRTSDYRTGKKAQRLFDESDLLQVMQVPRTVRSFKGWDRKPVVVQQIGTYLRNDPEGVCRAVRDIGATHVVNSLELLNLAPDAELLLWTVDVDMLGRLREEHRREPDGRIRIYHSPTNRAIKSTEAFIAACTSLARKYPIDMELVEGVPWAENLRRKAAADIVFDEVKLGYGLNSAEAWAMHIPALVGLIDPGARQLFMDRYGGFPYLDTTEETIEQRLEELIVSEEAREHWAEVGYRFVHQHHAQSVVAPQAVALYEAAGGMIYFVTPAWQRYDLTRVVLEQRRHVIDYLAARAVEARCVVVADDANADIAAELGFEILRRPNKALGRRFNDGIQHAAQQGAKWIVPIGSDSFIDPAYLFPLPEPGILRSSRMYALAEPGRLGRLQVKNAMGAGPYMIPRNVLPPTQRPAAEYLKRGVDSSTIKGLRRKWKREMVDLHPWQYVGFRHEGQPEGHPQLNTYAKLYGRLGVGEEYEVAERLSEFYPPRLVERALAVCEAREVAA